MIIAVTANAQRGTFSAVVHNAPCDYVKKAVTDYEVHNFWKILSEGNDSIRFGMTTETLIVFFEPQGKNTFLSQTYCHGNDCSDYEHKFATSLQSEVTKMASDFEADYPSVEKAEQENEELEKERQKLAVQLAVQQQEERSQDSLKKLAYQRIADSITSGIKNALVGKSGWLINPDLNVDSCGGGSSIMLPNVQHYKITKVDVNIPLSSNYDYGDEVYVGSITLFLSNDFGACYEHKEIGATFNFDGSFSTISPQKLHPKWSEKIWKAIRKGSVIIGMTSEQAKLSWGEPEDINRTITRRGSSEQWVYGNSYLYFTNGILDSIQN